MSKIRACVPLVAALLLAACAGAPGPRTNTSAPITSDLAHATFDSVWSIIHRTHFDADFEGVDWNAVRDTLRPRVAEVTTNDELRGLLNQMVGEVGLSHFGILAGSAIDAFEGDDDAEGGGGTADPGITLRLVDEDLIVWRVRDDSPARRAGVSTGWIVRSIDDRNLEERIAEGRELVDADQFALLVDRAAQAWMSGSAGTTCEMVFEDGAGASHSLDLAREIPPGQISRFGNLPPIRVAFTDSIARADDRRVAVIGFNIWLLPIAAQFDAAVNTHRDADGMIIDLRGNPGGIGGLAMGVAGHFFTEPTQLGVMSTRTGELTFRVNPRISTAAGERVEPFAGPVAILVDGLSMSTSEIFAQGMKVSGRVRVFGRSTPGAALPSLITRLPNGDALQHAIADFLDPEGNRLEKSGVVPDEVVPLDRTDLLAGRDATLDAALRWVVAEAEESSARR